MEQKVVDITYVRTQKQPSGILTKNVAFFVLKNIFPLLNV